MQTPSFNSGTPHGRFALAVCLGTVTVVMGLAGGALLLKRDDVGTSEDDVEFIRTLAEAYLDHRERLDPLTCRYTTAGGIEATSLNQLLDEQASSSPYPLSDGLLLAKGKQILSTHDSNREPEYTRSGNLIAVSGMSSAYLGGPEGHLRFSGNANLIAPNEDASMVNTIIGPLSMGIMGGNESYNPHVVINEYLQGARYLGRREHFGVTVEGVGFSFESGHEREYWFAPEWGFLPAKVVTRSVEHDYESVSLIAEARSLSGNRWFPMLVVSYSGPLASLDAFETNAGGQVPFRCSRIVTTFVDVETPPADEDFSLTLSAGTRCVREDCFTITLANDLVVEARDIAELLGRTQKVPDQAVVVSEETQALEVKVVYSDSRDFGVYLSEQGKVFEAEFEVVNHGNETIRFAEVRQYCGCSGAVLADDVLGPGDRTTFTLTVRENEYAEEFDRTVSCDLVTENDQIWRFSIEAHAFPQLSVFPRSIDFGDLEANVGSTQECEYRSHAYTREALFHLNDLTTSNDSVSFERIGAASIEELPNGLFRYTQKFNLSLLPSPQDGGQRANVTLSADNGEIRREDNLRVLWHAPFKYRVTPERAFYGCVEPSDSQPRQIDVEITRRDGAEFSIRSFNLDERLLEAADVGLVLDTAASTQRVTITLHPGQVDDRALFGELVIETDDPHQPIVTIPISALGSEELAHISR